MKHLNKVMLRAGMVMLAVVALASCKNDKLTVTGNLTNTSDTLLVYTSDEAPDTIAVKDGKFTYQMTVDKVSRLYIVRPETAAIVLLAVPGEKAEVSGDMMGDYTITGSKFFQDFDAQQKMLKDATQDNVVELIMNHVKENPTSEAALSLISIVALFCVMNTLLILGVQKTAEVGLLRSLGFGRGKIMAVFMIHGLIQCTAGIVLGLLASWAVLSNLQSIVNFLGRLGLQVFPEAVYGLSEIPHRIVASDVLWTVASVFAFGLLASWIPAMIAAGKDPVKALNE